MSEQVVDVNRIGKVYGDRILVRRLGEPEKKRGILIPASMAMKKEPKKIWFGLIMGFGHESKAHEDHQVNIGDRVGIEPLGHHYAGFKGTDGHSYVWVPDEHLCLADDGSILEFYEDKLDRAAPARVRVLGDRLLLRNVPDDENQKSRIHRVTDNSERDARIADILALGSFNAETGPNVNVGDRVVHVAEESGSSAIIDIFEPALTVLRATDLIATMKPAEVAA